MENRISQNKTVHKNRNNSWLKRWDRSLHCRTLGWWLSKSALFHSAPIFPSIRRSPPCVRHLSSYSHPSGFSAFSRNKKSLCDRLLQDPSPWAIVIRLCSHMSLTSLLGWVATAHGEQAQQVDCGTDLPYSQLLLMTGQGGRNWRTDCSHLVRKASSLGRVPDRWLLFRFLFN